MQHWKDPSRASWYESNVEAASDFHPASSFEKLTVQSVLVRVLLQRMAPYSLRFLKRVTHDQVTIKINGWVLITHDDTVHVARVSEMVQVNVLEKGSAKAYIRLWITYCSVPKEDAGSKVVLKSAEASMCMYIQYESVNILPLTRTETADRYSYI